MNKLNLFLSEINSFNIDKISKIIPGVKSMVFFTLLQSQTVLALDTKEHIVELNENAWRIVYNHTGSYKQASKFNGIIVRPGDKFVFSGSNIQIIRNGKVLPIKPKVKVTPEIEPEKSTHIKKEQEPQVISNKEVEVDSNLSYDFFMSLPKVARFNLVTREIKDGYFEIKFPNNEIEQKVTIDDIIPEDYNSTFLVRDKEIRYLDEETGKRKVQEDSYFNILGRDETGNFSSLLAGKKYKYATTILNGYLVKPFNLEMQDIAEHTFDNRFSPIPYVNETVIKNLYGEYITEMVNEHFGENSVIDEELFYSIVARESGFDPNALSPTGTRGLCMITIGTVKHILLQNIRQIRRLDRERIAEFNRKVALGNFEEEEIDNHSYDFIFELNDFIPAGRDIKLYESGNRYLLSGIDTKMYDPKTSIQLSLNYLEYLESQFLFIKDKQFRKELIIMSYNMGPGILRYIIKSDRKVKDLDTLLLRLDELINEEGMFEENNIFKGILTLAKLKEVRGYVRSVKRFHEG